MGTGGALDGIRVLDLGTRIGAPFCATLLGELGADVVKVEHPDGGDFMRSIGPFADGTSLFWAVEGRGKRSITLDLSKPDGQDVLRRLVEHADVLVENFRPGTLERWNLAPESLRAVNPKLVVARVSVFGQDGPYRDRPGLDRNGIALGGLLGITGFPDGPPVRPGVVIADYLSALFSAIGVLTALIERDRSGAGQDADVSLYESVLRVMEWTVAAYDRLGLVRERAGNRLPNSAPLDNYRTADGRYVCIVAAGDALFPRLCSAMKKPDLPSDARFRTLADRAANAEAINAIVAGWCAERTLAEIEETLIEHEVPVSGVYSIDQIAGDEQVRARSSLIVVEDPVLGPILQQGAVPRLSRTPPKVLRGAPALGQHDDEVYRGLLGMSEESLTDLRRKGVIGG
ncbi:MAG TPA: CoA transferase [Actinomycetota bacterium]